MLDSRTQRELERLWKALHGWPFPASGAAVVFRARAGDGAWPSPSVDFYQCQPFSRQHLLFQIQKPLLCVGRLGWWLSREWLMWRVRKATSKGHKPP